MTDILRELQQQSSRQQAAALKAYGELIASAVDGASVKADKATAILAGAGKTLGDFESDVAALRQRRDDSALLANLMNQERELPKLRSQLQAAEEKLNGKITAAEGEFNAVAWPISTRIAEIDRAVPEIPNLRARLLDGAPEPLASEMAAVRTRISSIERQVRQLQAPNYQRRAEEVAEKARYVTDEDSRSEYRQQALSLLAQAKEVDDEVGELTAQLSGLRKQLTALEDKALKA